jgi:CBS domain-containing protein
MKVSELMVNSTATCKTTTNLCEIAEIMWKENCGFLPVVNIQDKVIGVVTDRDLFIALGTRNARAAELAAADVACGRVYSCRPEDDVHVALATMAKERVRRLPVLNQAGRLVGVLSADDITLGAHMGDLPELSCKEVVRALQKIYRKHAVLAIPKRQLAAA